MLRKTEKLEMDNCQGSQEETEQKLRILVGGKTEVEENDVT